MDFYTVNILAALEIRKKFMKCSTSRIKKCKTRKKLCIQGVLLYGSLPDTLQFTNRKEYLSNLFEKIFNGDIIARHKII